MFFGISGSNPPFVFRSYYPEGELKGSGLLVLCWVPKYQIATWGTISIQMSHGPYPKIHNCFGIGCLLLCTCQ